MKNPGLLLMRDSSGSKVIGDPWVTTTNGCGDIGNVPRLKEHTGRTRTMITIRKAGNGTKDTGIAKTTTMTIGGTMIGGGGIATTMTRGTSTDCQHHRNGTS